MKTAFKAGVVPRSKAYSALHTANDSTAPQGNPDSLRTLEVPPQVAFPSAPSNVVRPPPPAVSVDFIQASKCPQLPMATAPASPCEQLQEQNKFLRAQVRLLQANCQWLSTYNETLLDFCSSRAADYPDNTSSSACDSFLEENYMIAATRSSYYEVTDPPLSREIFPVRELSYCNHTWTQPIHPEIFALCDAAPDGMSPLYQLRSPGPRSTLPLQSPDFWLDEFADSSSSHLATQLAASSDPSTTGDVFAILPPEAIDRVIDPYRQSVLDEPYSSQALRSKQEIDCGLHTSSSPPPGNHPLEEIERIPCAFPQDGGLSLESETSLDILSLGSGNIVPGRTTQAFPQLADLSQKLLLQPQWVPDVQECLDMGRPEGLLDHYIYALRDFMQRLNTGGTLGPKLRNRLMTKGVLWVVHEAWPQAAHFWKATASFEGFLQAELWRNFPDSSVYHSMHAAYRPTPIQLSVPHSPIIDWLPWPDLRDKIITSQERIDVDLVCKTAIQNLVAHRRAVFQARPQKRIRRDGEGNSCPAPKTSFRVWDLCILEETAGRKPQESSALTYRPKSAPVRALEKAYALEYNDFQTQKLHPDFFTAFPSLFSQSTISDYTVQELSTVRSCSNQDVLGAPQPISTASLARLEAFDTRSLKGAP